MKQIIELVKKYWVFVLLATLVVILLAFWLIQKTKPEIPSGPVPSPTAGILPQPQSQYSQSLGEGLYYTIFLSETDFSQLPSSLPVYQIKPLTQKEILSRYDKLIKQLGFTVNPQEQERPDGRYLIWQEGENYLQTNLNSGQLLFAGKVSLSPPDKTLNSLQIQDLVKQKLSAWQLITEEAEIKNIEGFGVAGLELIPVENLNQAIVFQIAYSASFEGYPLVGLGPAKNLIEAKINNQGVLNSLIFNLLQVENKPMDYYPLKNYEETSQEIKEGKGQIIEILTPQREERSLPSLKEIQEIRITSVSLVYYVTIEPQEYYQPVFLFKGKMILKEESLSISLILPAIVSGYLESDREHFLP